MKLTTIWFLLLIPFLTVAQKKSENIRINTLDKEGHLQGFYYEEFFEGKVISKDGGYGKTKLNFNCITNEMLFIAANGDTLKLAKPEATAMVTIESDTFEFHKNTFLKKISHRGSPIELFEKISLDNVEEERKSAYGYSSITSDRSSIATVDRNNLTQVQEDKNLIFKRNSDVLISDGNGDYLPLKQASLFKLFPKYKQEIKAYIDVEKININKKDDLIKLLDYSSELSSKSAD